MAIYDYRKFKVSMSSGSAKAQGLLQGDIVRRQFYSGGVPVSSLMCVLETGTDNVADADTGALSESPYFVGALLEGDVPHDGEVLDFARVTSLFDTDRSGALYLTASDDGSPFMDVIDGVGRDGSLCWPDSVAGDDAQDSETQYVVKGKEALSASYSASEDDNARVLHIVRGGAVYYGEVGLCQDFYKYVANPDRVLVSYKIKATRALPLHMSLGYQDGSKMDGETDVLLSEDWQYKLHAVTIDYSGRHLRSFRLDMSGLLEGDEVLVSDLNIILLSSIANYGSASKVRVGRLSGVADPVFGSIDGYGGYMQKLFASGAAHISGTLTAGDENGFSSTFYAGKIHRNVFVNSLDVSFVTGVSVESSERGPVGVGKVYGFENTATMEAQSALWLYAKDATGASSHIGKQYTFSFWLKPAAACHVSVSQNGKVVRVFDILESDAQVWSRRGVTFDILRPQSENSVLLLSVAVDCRGETYITAPQLEAGITATQYQPTDAVLDSTDDYGAWFSRGGIGGTIQNPLLKLNYDGEGSVGTRTKSFLLRTDGAGYLANENIKWDSGGNVRFGKDVTMGWDNLDDSAKGALVSKSIRITGADTFTLLGDMTGADPTTSPADITLTLEEENISSTSSQRQWSYLDGYDYVPFDGENGKTLTVFPFDSYWNGSNSLSVRCDVDYLGERYSDTFTVRRQYIVGYTIEITSSAGVSCKNSTCRTTLTANVYYQGKLVDPEYAAAHYTFRWCKFHLPDLDHEVDGWWIGDDGAAVIDTSAREITLDCAITGQDCYQCELLSGDSFPYDFPITF